jgi:nucleoside-diphosphate-sugar epimerase
MNVFLAGASGGIGRRLVPILIANGHHVVGTTRSAESADEVRQLGATPVVLDGLDRDAVIAAVRAAQPEVIIHHMTGLTGVRSFKRFDDEFTLTNRLRTEGLDNLLDAALEVSARRVVAQSYGNWNYDRTGGPVKSEDDPLDSNPPAAMSRTMDAIRYLESRLLETDGIEGVALRVGNFYGPRSNIGEGGRFLDQIQKRQFPIIGDGAGVWSFIHYDDAAMATMLAMNRGERGIYNISDDDPAAVSVWLPELARILGAKPPRRVPKWLGKLVGGEPGVSMFTRIRGASNTRAKRELGWQLLYPSWRDGFKHGLGPEPPPFEWMTGSSKDA